ncbi:hypothetical protein ACROYT_G032789 [Oculina patagonica]
MEVYCVKERQFTPNVPGSERVETTKNGRKMLKVKCASCGITKTRFVKTQGAGIDIHKAIGKLPKPKKGWTLPGHNYTGPYNPLEKQLTYDPKTGKILKIKQQPTGATDAVAMQHDVDYAVCAGKKDEKSCKHAADKKMVKALDAVPKNKRQWGHTLARNVIASKQKVGLGVGETVNKKIGEKIPGFQQAQDLAMMITGAVGGDKKLLEKYWSGDIAKGAFNTKTAPRYVPRPKFDVSTPNAVHQADLLFLPHDRLPRGRKVYKYALTVVDVASRYKEAEPLTSKDSTEVAKGFQAIYRRSALKWPQMLQVDPGREFMGAVTKEMENRKTAIRRGRVNIHRDQAIVERFNRTLAERLFGYQYSVELTLPSGQRSTAWVKRLPEVIAALNDEVTRLTGKKPSEAIKLKAVAAKPSTPYLRPVGKSEKKLPSSVNVRYLYQPGELEGGGKRATDPIWSLKVFSLERAVMKPNEPVLYYLQDGPKRGLVREELLVVPPDTSLPPVNAS